jgi:hypothetical protein
VSDDPSGGVLHLPRSSDEHDGRDAMDLIISSVR